VINSQVVPSYEDTALPAVREYRQLMEKYRPLPPRDLMAEGYTALPHSYVSFEGFLNAKLLVDFLRNMGPSPIKSRIKGIVESIKSADLGIDSRVSFGPNKHQGLDRIYYTSLEGDRFVPLADWKRWKK